MTEQKTQRERLIEECLHIKEEAEYTAQAHFMSIDRAWLTGRGTLLVIPATIAAAANLAVALGAPTGVSAIGVVGGLVAAVAGYLGVDAKQNAHRQAATEFTLVRQAARRLAETYSEGMTDKDLKSEVRALNDRYDDLVRRCLPTSKKAFEEGRKRIKDGIYSPDFREGKTAQGEQQ